MRGKNLACMTVVVLVSILLSWNATAVVDLDGRTLQPAVVNSEPNRRSTSVTGIPHVPIAVDGDTNFSVTALLEGWFGNGTLGNPYIIEDFDIDRGGAPGHCISISNTRVHFIIRNCNLIGANVDPGSGIYLNNVTNGQLINNTTTNNHNGIYLYQSNSNTLVNNTSAGNSDIGIQLEDSDFNTVANNSCNNNQAGIYLLMGADNNGVFWNVLIDNLANGVMGPFQLGNVFDYNYWSDYSGTDADADGIGDTAYVFTRIIDNHPLMYLPTPPGWTEQPVDQTVEFGFSIFHYKLNVTCPSPVTWEMNHALFSVDDVGMVSSGSVLLIDIYDLRVVVTNIYGSILQTNLRVNVMDTTSPGWLIIPTDQTLYYGEGLDYQTAAIDLSGIDHWELNDTVHFTYTVTHYSLGSTIRLTNVTALSAGVYSLEIRAYDPYDNYCSATFVVAVLDPVTATTAQTEGDSTLFILAGVGISGAAAVVMVLVLLRRQGNE